MAGTIILFYKYVTLSQPHDIAQWQKELCTKLNLKGRVILATEGINGTLGGASRDIDAYKKAMDTHPSFGSIDFKESTGSADDFPKLRVKVKEEIVHLGLDPHTITPEDGGIHLTPEETHRLLENKPDNLLVLDCRNNYESRIGHFEDAVKPDVKNFRDFPHYVDTHLDELKDKDVLMYCTGGIRCERASSYLKKQGVSRVYQMHGGIHRYAATYPNGFFRGKNYVFDDRIAVPVTSDVLTTCDWCNTSCDDYTNCSNTKCNKQFIACAACARTKLYVCSPACYKLVCTNQVPQRTSYRTGSNKSS